MLNLSLLIVIFVQEEYMSYSLYSQTCFSELFYRNTTIYIKTKLLVSLDNGLSLKLVLNETVCKDHLPKKTAYLVSLEWSLCPNFIFFKLSLSINQEQYVVIYFHVIISLEQEAAYGSESCCTEEQRSLGFATGLRGLG